MTQRTKAINYRLASSWGINIDLVPRRGLKSVKQHHVYENVTAFLV